jgi:hypothetical protein
MVAIQRDADAEAAQWRIVDAALATRRFIEGDEFTLADIALGAYARRWFGVEGVSKPPLAHLERWFAQFGSRPGFAQFIAPPMSRATRRFFGDLAAGAADPDADGPADLHAGVGAVNFDKARPVSRAGIDRPRALQGKRLGEGCRCGRLRCSVRIGRHWGDQQQRGDDKESFSHPALYRAARRRSRSSART